MKIIEHMTSPTPVQDASFLGAYAKRGAFTDCYATTVPGAVSLPEFIEAFYTTPLFKVERWLLAKANRPPSTDRQAHQIAVGESHAFSAWKVENRSDNEILLKAGQTRSWLSVAPVASKPGATTLLFGSAVVPMRSGGKFGLAFHALLRFHQLYSKLLLSSAARRISNFK
jgi:hypothetical protein